MELANPEDRGFDGERLQRIDRFLTGSYLDTGRLKTNIQMRNVSRGVDLPMFTYYKKRVRFKCV